MVMAEEIRLAEPDVTLRQEFLDYCQEFQAANEPFVHGQLPEATADFAGLLRKWSDGAKETNLPEGPVPGSIYWLVQNGRILGTARLRYRLNKNLMHEGGHIGYDVRPTQRRKGYATLILTLMLGKARDRGLGRVLVTCDKDNAASARTIQKNAGILENEVISKRSGKLVQRYWIDL
jgi:predicted acetyltransferase